MKKTNYLVQAYSCPRIGCQAVSYIRVQATTPEYAQRKAQMVEAENSGVKIDNVTVGTPVRVPKKDWEVLCKYLP